MERDRGRIHIPEGYVDYDEGVSEVKRWIKKRRNPFLVAVLGVGPDVGKTTFCGEIESKIIEGGKFYPIHLSGLVNQRVEDWQRMVDNCLPAFVYEDTFGFIEDKGGANKILVAKLEMMLSGLNELIRGRGWAEIGERDVLPVILTANSRPNNRLPFGPVKLDRFGRGVWVFNGEARRK